MPSSRRSRGRSRRRAGTRTAFGACDVATLQREYDVPTLDARYSTCLDLSTTLTLAASPTSVAYGGTRPRSPRRSRSPTSRAYDRLRGNAVSGRTVTLQRRAPGTTTWITVGDDGGRQLPAPTTSRSSSWPSTEFRAVFKTPTDEGLKGDTSPTVRSRSLAAPRRPARVAPAADPARTRGSVRSASDEPASTPLGVIRLVAVRGGDAGRRVRGRCDRDRPRSTGGRPARPAVAVGRGPTAGDVRRSRHRATAALPPDARRWPPRAATRSSASSARSPGATAARTARGCPGRRSRSGPASRSRSRSPTRRRSRPGPPSGPPAGPRTGRGRRGRRADPAPSRSPSRPGSMDRRRDDHIRRRRRSGDLVLAARRDLTWRPDRPARAGAAQRPMAHSSRHADPSRPGRSPPPPARLRHAVLGGCRVSRSGRPSRLDGLLLLAGSRAARTCRCLDAASGRRGAPDRRCPSGDDLGRRQDGADVLAVSLADGTLRISDPITPGRAIDVAGDHGGRSRPATTAVGPFCVRRPGIPTAAGLATARRRPATPTRA